MFENLKKPIEQGRLIILFGAGASLTSTDHLGANLLSSSALSQLLAHEADLEYEGEDLQTVYSAVTDVLGTRTVAEILERLYRNTEPSTEYKTIAKYCWRRIYTLNIDDALDRALISNSSQRIRIRHKNDPIADKDPLYQMLDYVKLNGSSDRLHEGVIFSAKEYGMASSKTPSWYEELAKDYFGNCFLFVGTQINEPLLYHQIERARLRTGDNEQKSFVLTPSASPIQKASLQSRNLTHIAGTLSDFVRWLSEMYSNPLAAIDIALNANPRMRAAFEAGKNSGDAFNERLLENVLLIDKSTLIANEVSQPEGKVRKFYKGYKPTWKDVFEGVPAELIHTRQFYEEAFSALRDGRHLLVVYGPAGSGKTTLLMQLCVKLHESGIPVYYIEDPPEKFPKTMEYLESIHNERYCVIYNRLSDIDLDIRKILVRQILQRGLIVCAERESFWETRGKFRLLEFCENPFRLSRIRNGDAELILNKLKQYGPWTRLGAMRQIDRERELIRHAKRQLLIGLLETTSGQGYKDIIEYDYLRISQNESDKYFLLIVGLATVHRMSIAATHVARALAYCKIEEAVDVLINRLSGTVHESHGLLFARHPVYMEYIFSDVVDNKTLAVAHNAILYAMGGYGSDLHGIGRRERILYDYLINHKFAMNIYHQDEATIAQLYRNVEKLFERSGVYWLQAGRIHRELGHQMEAYDSFMNALTAFDERHKKYAKFEVARQQIILALSPVKKKKALALLDSAKSIIEEIKDQFFEDDIHPLIVLAEGHVKITLAHFGEEQARAVASEYSNLLYKERNSLYAEHIEKAWAIMAKFALNGTWPTTMKEGGGVLCLHASS